MIHGHWRLAEWKLSNQELLKLTQQCLELGINTFDHADIYGNYSCERLFGNALANKKSLRNEIKSSVNAVLLCFLINIHIVI